jgi:4-methylaminobutanoate oxidase (formaldehyde-forming)
MNHESVPALRDLPDRSEVVIIGGGVIGCAIAWQLACRGRSDVTVIERRRLTEGTTWHAAGLVGQLRSSTALTGLMRASVLTYADLEQRTGYATGWHPVGSVRIAASDGRWAEMQRQAAIAATVGLDAQLIRPSEAQGLFPLLGTASVRGAVWVPSDGFADPSQLTHSFATGAKAAGASIGENCPVRAIEHDGRRIAALITERGRIECDVVVNATGMWGRRTGKLAGSDLAVGAVEHQYVVTGPIAGLPPDSPTLRDPDARIYLKPEAGGLLIGGWEDGTRMPWPVPPDNFGPELFPPDHQRFEPLALAAAGRIPAFADAGIRTWVNGPIPFTPDAEPLIGRDGTLANLIHCCGFSAGIAAAGGAAQAVAGLITEGDSSLDLAPFAPGRFGDLGGFVDRDRQLTEAYAGYYRLRTATG